jgi:hypothetical protein
MPGYAQPRWRRTFRPPEFCLSGRQSLNFPARLLTCRWVLALSIQADRWPSGSRPITIEAVTTSADPADSTYPVRLAGPVLYTTDMDGYGTPKTHVLRNLTLVTWAGNLHRHTAARVVVRQQQRLGCRPGLLCEGALPLLHIEAVPWSINGAKLIMHIPGGVPGKAGTICAPSKTMSHTPPRGPAGPRHGLG